LPGFPQPDWRLGRRAGAAIASFAAYSGWAWARYGNAHPERRPPDPLLDRFLPGPDVDEYHQHTIRAPAPVTFAVAKQHDFQASPLLWGMFWLREGVPALLRGRLYRREGSRSFLDWLLAAGWGVLAEHPGREFVVGCYTRPWQGQVRFQSLPPRDGSSDARATLARPLLLLPSVLASHRCIGRAAHTCLGTCPAYTSRMILCPRWAVGPNMSGQPPSIRVMPCSRPSPLVVLRLAWGEL
jgi:hypothetical protein